MIKHKLLYLLVLITCIPSVNMVLADALVKPETEVNEQVIKVSTHKFEFSPNVIKLKKGVPVILEFTSSDVIMGFNAPDFKSRVTIVPGKAVRVRIMPQKTGEFAFFCDVFCGDGHEDMTGMILVEA